MNIKSRTYHLYNVLIKLCNFDPNMLILDKKAFKGINVYYSGYVTNKEEYKINSVINNLKFLSVTIVIRSVFEDDGEYYPQVFLDDCLYEL